jgi:hypothetical protein
MMRLLNRFKLIQYIHSTFSSPFHLKDNIYTWNSLWNDPSKLQGKNNLQSMFVGRVAPCSCLYLDTIYCFK